MKQALKTILSLMLALVMAFSAVACGDKSNKTGNTVNDDFFTDSNTQMEVESDSTTANDSSKDEDSNAEGTGNSVGGKSWNEVLASMPKNLRGSTIKIANWNPVSEYTGASTAIKKFEKATGITVEWVTIDYGVYTTRLATMVASDTAPDVARTRTPNPAWMQSFQSIDAANYDFSDEAWNQILMKDYTVNGVTYATSLKNTHIGSVDMMFYNKDIISKYNYEDPYKLWKNGKWTMNKFISM
ncbi:MAG: extracellular solute-binding protein, partial [Oscillospiraceae bacterium]|nr:extracellular solute-binding protein [Oscillospiraceae bacterium]